MDGCCVMMKDIWSGCFFDLYIRFSGDSIIVSRKRYGLERPRLRALHCLDGRCLHTLDTRDPGFSPIRASRTCRTVASIQNGRCQSTGHPYSARVLAPAPSLALAFWPLSVRPRDLQNRLYGYDEVLLISGDCSCLLLMVAMQEGCLHVDTEASLHQVSCSL